MNRLRRLVKVLAAATFCFAVLSAAATSVRAQSLVSASWNASAGNWTTASDWNCPSSAVHCIPNNASGKSYDVFINAPSGDVMLDNTSSLASVAINALSVASAFSALHIESGESLNVTGNASVGTDGQLSISNGASLPISGSLTNSGSIDMETSPATPCQPGTCFFTTTLSVGGNLTNPGNLLLLNGADGGKMTLEVAGNLTNSGSIAAGYLGILTGLDIGGELTNSGRLELFPSAATAGSVSNSGSVYIGGRYGSIQSSSLTLRTGGAYSQNGGSTVVDGTLISPSVDIAGGTLMGNGAITGNVTNGGVVSPGDPSAPTPGNTLAINGNYTQNTGGTLLIDVSGPSDFNILHVTGQASLDGRAEFDFLNGYVPGPNTDFAFFEAGSVAGDFASLSFVNLNCPTCTFNVSTLSLDTGSTPPATPEPGSLILFGTGLLGLAWLVRRKHVTSD